MPFNGVNTRDMKNLWSKIKEIPSVVFDKLKENAISVYIILGMLSLFFIHNTVQNTRHINEKIELIEENIDLAEGLEERDELIYQFQQTLSRQADVIGDQRMYMIQIQHVLGLQNELIKKLIQKLEDLGEWPPEKKEEEKKGRSWATQSDEEKTKDVRSTF